MVTGIALGCAIRTPVVCFFASGLLVVDNSLTLHQHVYPSYLLLRRMKNLITSSTTITLEATRIPVSH